MTQLVLIAAIAANGVIGANNALPWRLPEDLKRFKALTLGHAILMGRKTWESLGRPLPGRHNIVVSRNRAYSAPGATVVDAIDAALAIAAQSGDERIFVIGGAEIYQQTLTRATRLELTEIKSTIDGDAFFPVIDRADWTENSREPHLSDSGLAYDFVSYTRNWIPS